MEAGLSRHAEAFDLPFELDPALCLHPRAHRLAKPFEVRAAGVPLVDEKIAVHLRHLGVADAQSPAPRLIDQLPGLASRRVLEGRTAGAALDRLHLLAI